MKLGSHFLLMHFFLQNSGYKLFSTVVYLINQMHIISHLKILLHEKLFQKSPKYFDWWAFNCLCFLWLQPYKSNKLEFWFTKYCFLGYSTIHKGYKCLILVKKWNITSYYLLWIFFWPHHHWLLVVSNQRKKITLIQLLCRIVLLRYRVH